MYILIQDGIGHFSVHTEKKILSIFWTNKGKKRFLRNKIFVALPYAVIQMKNFNRPLFERSFQGRHFSFWITEGINDLSIDQTFFAELKKYNLSEDQIN
jgi:hypothetical protein